MIDQFLFKEFKQNYNCWDFVREVWLYLTNTDLGSQTPDTFNVAEYHKKAGLVANTLTALAKPESPCLVLMQRKRIEPHIGVYYKDRVLHLTKSGAQYMPLGQVTAGYPTVSFYK